ncbi:dihydrofolate reductase [Lactiplantibacillus sp. WILCCON 0030]|uniref:Dihydrofolate reductase n=1 Tax=Lactiplantibacillus brownii TaxID=3069269 RepID=A0ABU1A8Y5_9LACO|nr:dihydrofolate reductase [Lactiplantibacillus brownii]MDQ7937427.1 dihydrofolate reductase [Lactiplantibacillus brownii]
MIGLIWAQDENGLIGANGQLPWHLSADLKRFKALTTEQTVVMGRKTFAGFKRPLPHRQNIVLSHQSLNLPAGVQQFKSLDELWALNAQQPNDLIFVIGGAAVFEAVLPRADRLYRTAIQHAFTGDTWMPAINYADWQVTAEQTIVADEQTPWTFSFTDYQRR